MAFEGIVGAGFYLAGRMPQGGAGASAFGVFPFDVYFDLKQAVAFAPGWLWFVAAVGVSVFVRAVVLASTVWLSEERRDDLGPVLARAGMLSARAALMLFPAAAMFFIGVATRYTPFVLLAALLGLFPAASLAGRGVRLDASSEGGRKDRPGRHPGLSGVLGYGYLVAASGAAIAVLSERGTWAPALFVALMGPVHGLIFLGWRERSLSTESRSPRLSLAVTLVVFGALLANSMLDRSVREPAPEARPDAEGRLLILSGVDSATDRGSLYGFDPRAIGFPFEATTLLSYRAGARPYVARDTRGDLDEIARIVAEQIAGFDPPRLLLGHSQASQILDRIIAHGLPVPEGAAVLAPSAPYPPPVDVPPSGVNEPGRVGGDLGRGFARLLDLVGLEPFDLGAPASPTNLDAVDASEGTIPRLSVWTLADSVWLSGDWRHQGGVNVVAFTDHVGVINDPLAVDAVAAFFAGRRLGGDDLSWRGFTASAIRYVFEPWRPQ